MVSIATVQKAIHKKDLPIALIPFIFAIQQIVEGFLWLSLMNNDAPKLQFWLSQIYGIFIGFVWPLFAPFAVYCSETNNKRRRIIASIGIVGVGLAIYTVIGLINQPIIAEITHHSINYKHDVGGYQLVIALYLLATCVPFIFSSYKYLYIAGIVITIGFFVTYLNFLQTFASVWCFFAAITSTLIYFYFIHRIREPLVPIP